MRTCHDHDAAVAGGGGRVGLAQDEVLEQRIGYGDRADEGGVLVVQERHGWRSGGSLSSWGGGESYGCVVYESRGLSFLHMD